MSTVIQIDTAAQAHIQAYIEYKNIVGDTDGGKLLSEKEYAKRKKKALRDQMNRMYVTWLNEDNLECRAVGPSSKCFCGHKFRDHDSCNKQKKIHCKMGKCKCKCFEYIPIRGSQDLKCHCKHSYKLHNISTRKCYKRHPVKGICSCHGFISSFGCACGQTFSSHRTLFETRTERERAGKRVDNLAMGSGMGCAAMGGVTTFSSLLDGVDRMSIEANPISDLRLQFMRPRNKLTEEDEMAIYARKYENKSLQKPSVPQKNPSLHIANKLKLLKHKQRHSSVKSANGMECKAQEHHDIAINEINQTVCQIERQLMGVGLSAAKQYALDKRLKMERSKIIRYQRKKAQDKRRFEKGL
eukprot:1139333_1